MNEIDTLDIFETWIDKHAKGHDQIHQIDQEFKYLTYETRFI